MAPDTEPVSCAARAGAASRHSASAARIRPFTRIRFPPRKRRQEWWDANTKAGGRRRDFRDEQGARTGELPASKTPTPKGFNRPTRRAPTVWRLAVRNLLLHARGRPKPGVTPWRGTARKQPRRAGRHPG